MAYFGDLSFVCCLLDEAYRDARFDCRWPDLYSVQYLLRGRMYYGRNGGPRVTLTGPAIYWIDPRYTYQLGTVDRQDVRHLVNFRGPRGRRLLLDGFDRLDERGWMAVRGPGRFDALFRVLQRTAGDPAAERHAEAVILIERLMAMLLGPAASPEGAQPHRQEIDRLAQEIRGRISSLWPANCISPTASFAGFFNATGTARRTTTGCTAGCSARPRNCVGRAVR